MDSIVKENIESLIDQGYSHETISNILKRDFPGERGFSVRSVRRFCKENGITRTTSQNSINEMVAAAVDTVGPTYGRKMMKGFIRQNFGTNVSEERVAKSLQIVAPRYHQNRRNNTARQTNPIPYRADYFGHKIHVDQNEKLCMYGATHVVAIDGHSRFVTASSTMPIKNNKKIYEEVYRDMVLKYGLMDQLRVDHGREFYLMLGIHENLAHLRHNQTIQPYQQTQSKRNLPIERFWVEVNGRVNYPIKSILVDMDNNGYFDMENPVHKFCVSWLTRRVSNFGLNVCISSWNEHPIPGRGTPSHLKEITKRTVEISQNNDLPMGDGAVAIYSQRYNGTLNEFANFGEDLIGHDEFSVAIREQNFSARFDIPAIYGSVVNGHSQMFNQALMFILAETCRLAS